jgi:Saxitoxin biosynthesis operon protein SxtJ
MIDIQWNPERKQLRQFAAIWFPAFCALVGWIVGKKTGHWGGVEIAWGVGGGIALAGFIHPPLIRPVFVGLILVTYPLGWVVSHLLLGMIFYGIVTPIGLFLRMMGHDPLQLQPPTGITLWKTPAGGNDPASYLRQS